MIIAAINESPIDNRVAITPNVVKQYNKLELQVHCEINAGEKAGFANEFYLNAGAQVIANREDLLKHTNILVTVSEPKPENLVGLCPKALVVSHIENFESSPLIQWALQEKMSLFSMNLIPRISRAQNIDSLSSQANLAGYRAVLEGIHHFNRAIPMMMTAAGMIQPAKILVLGAGVAGLQAIATAKRLGAVVYAFDVRRAAKEQVESLGAEFIEVSGEADAETSAGYAKEMSEDYKMQQAALIDKYAQMADIVICTALIPNRQAPILISAKTVAAMKPGSVIVDLATAKGGNCELSEKDKLITAHHVTLVGFSNLAGSIAATASELYANNVLNLLRLLMAVPGSLVFNAEDEIIKQALICHEGVYMPYQSIKESQDA